MDNKHNDNNNDDNATIKRKRGRGTRMWDEDKGRGRGKRTNFGCSVIVPNFTIIIHTISQLTYHKYVSTYALGFWREKLVSAVADTKGHKILNPVSAARSPLARIGATRCVVTTCRRHVGNICS